ncbi:hypothetical protein [Nonomuraea basaltis]|uniref:hypothetical protein n=1 Tax=Nonomuraea basaltis TaxID=2495887 RepID=UPI0014872DF5|nr:hypothetical protein [Nonomuraea basaltis]
MPDLVGAVLLASAVAAGVLASSRGSAWGRLPSRPLGCADAFAVPPAGAPEAARRRRAAGIGAIGTRVMLGGAIGVTGATVLIDRPPRRPVPAHASVPVAALMAAVLLAATALVRVAGASGHETEHRSQRAAEEEPATPRRLLAGPRDLFDQMRGAAPARFDASDSRVVNPR